MGKRQHIDIRLTEEENELLKERASKKGLCKTDYARTQLFKDEEEGDDDIFLSLQEFANMIYVSESYVRKLCKNKKIEYYKIGKKIRIRKSEVEKFRIAMEEKVEPPQYLNSMQASEYLTIGRNTLIKYIKEGEIRANYVGKGYLIPRKELDNFALKKRDLQRNADVRDKP